MDKKLENNEPGILSFKTPNAFEKWLSKHHNKVNGILLRFYKKESGKKTYEIDFDTSLGSGIYVLVLETGQQTLVKKIIIY